ncbi:MAG: transposase [Dehalococcoidia bacterium]
MAYDPDKHHRRSIRLRGYDYGSAGAYSITVVTQERACLFGDVVNGEMKPNHLGDIVQACWEDLPAHYPHAALDAFTLMPNHVHGIIVLSVGLGVLDGTRSTREGRASRGHGVPEVLRAFKAFSARRINEARGMEGTSVWQRNYYEHVIRDDAEVQATRQYIADNPLQWALDAENPAA